MGLFVGLMCGACGVPEEEPAREIVPAANIEDQLPMATTTTELRPPTTAPPPTASPTTEAPPTTVRAFVPTTAQPAPVSTQPPTTAASSSVYFENCTEARNAGAAPVRRSDPGYGPHLDRDGDGVGCE